MRLSLMVRELEDTACNMMQGAAACSKERQLVT